MADVPDYTQNMAQPVSRDGFFYAGEGLYVKPEGATTAIHHRRDATSLHALLTYAPPPPSTEPELTKKGEVAKRPLRTYKDQPVHFYSAQLALYGLKVFKTKDAAKKNLLMAFRGGNTLDVPEHLVQLERELKAEYDQANKVAVDTYYAEKAQREAAQREFEHNRALFDGLDGNDDGLDQQIADLRIGEDDASQTAAVLELLGGLTQAELALLVARLVCDDPSLMVCVEEEVDEIRARRDVDDVAPAPTKQAAMKGNEIFNDPPARGTTKQTARKSTGAKAPRRKPTAVASRSQPIPPPTSGWGRLFTSGFYKVTVPYITEEWSDFAIGHRIHLKVVVSSTGAHLWGSFDFGAISGVLKTYGGPPPDVGSGSTADFKVHFKWRGHEQGEGEMTFGDYNIGHVTFLEGGKRIKGVIDGSFLGTGKATFTGTTMPKATVSPKSLKKWKKEWRNINQRAYDAASSGRWGGWSEQPRPERPAASDTSAGEGRGSSDDDEDEAEDEDGEGSDYDYIRIVC